MSSARAVGWPGSAVHCGGSSRGSDCASFSLNPVFRYDGERLGLWGPGVVNGPTNRKIVAAIENETVSWALKPPLSPRSRPPPLYLWLPAAPAPPPAGADVRRRRRRKGAEAVSLARGICSVLHLFLFLRLSSRSAPRRSARASSRTQRPLSRRARASARSRRSNITTSRREITPKTAPPGHSRKTAQIS